MFDYTTVVVPALCYGASTAISIRLREDLAIPTAAALVPSVVIASATLSPGAWMLVGLGPLVALVALLISRAHPSELVFHLVVGSAVLAGGHFLLPAANRPATIVLLAVGGSLFYAVGELVRERIASRRPRALVDLKMWWLLLGVVLSASGLTALAVNRIGWSALPAMAAVLALIKREFEGFALSREALDQTLRAVRMLEARHRLAEGSSPPSESI